MTTLDLVNLEIKITSPELKQYNFWVKNKSDFYYGLVVNHGRLLNFYGKYYAAIVKPYYDIIKEFKYLEKNIWKKQLV